MSEKNRRIALVIILILTVIWAGYNYPFGSKRNRPQALADSSQTALTQTPQAQTPTRTRLNETTGATRAAGAPAPILDSLWGVPEEELALREAKPWPRDPFYKRHKTKKFRKKQSKRSYKLKAIIYSADSPSAYLNGRVVRQGDNVSGATVIKISRNSVTLRIGQEYQTIKLK